MITARFENIGPIKKAELELGDLTIIAGQNNTGKTYLAYTLYGFLDFQKDNLLNLLYESRDYPEEYNIKIKEIAMQMEATSSAEITLDKYKYMSNWLTEETSKLFSEKFIHKVFNYTKNEFEKTSFQFKSENELTKGEIPIRSAENGKTLIKYFPQGKNLKFEIDNPEYVIHERHLLKKTHLFFEKIVKKNNLEPFILTAERLGIPLFYKDLDSDANKLVRFLQILPDIGNFDLDDLIEKASVRHTIPIQNNIDFIRDLFDIAKQKSELSTDAVSLVKNMVGGYYRAGQDVIKFISNDIEKNKFEIPLHLASSSARGILDLYFYLKHLAAPGQILMIDEPESHLSPSNQILMARLLAFCVNNGIKVLITTHSDYIVKEINNLIMLHRDFEGKQEFLKKHKKEYTEKDCLDPNSVKAYICEKGGLSRCDIDERGIKEMSVFDNAIDNINLICGELNTYIDIETLEDD